MDRSSPSSMNDFYHEVALEEIRNGKVDSVVWAKALTYRGSKSGDTDKFYIMLRVIDFYKKEILSKNRFNLLFIFAYLKFLTSSKRVWASIFVITIFISFAVPSILPRYKHVRGPIIIDTWTGDLIKGEFP